MARLYQPNWESYVPDVDEVVDWVNADIRDMRPLCIYLSDEKIRRFVRELDNLNGLGGPRFCADQLTRDLTDCVEEDKDSNNRSQGLHRSRHRFLVLSFVARRLRSRPIANALMRFLCDQKSEIMRKEKNDLLTEWGTAIGAIQNLVDEDEWREAFRGITSLGPPYFEEWRRPALHRSIGDHFIGMIHGMMFDLDHDRGRHHPQTYDVSRPRPSVPARRSAFLDRPLTSRTAYDSPMLSQFGAIHEHQHSIMLDLAALQRRVDNLEHRY